MIISADAQIDLGRPSRTPPFTIPARFAMRVGATWAEALEGCLAGDIEWGTLAAYRTRPTLAPIPKGLDRIEELNDRLDLSEQGRFDDLIGRDESRLRAASKSRLRSQLAFLSFT